MRTYTNFDLWNYIKFLHKLGKVEYKGRICDLDEGVDLLRLAIELFLDEVISISHPSNDDGDLKQSGVSWSLKFKLLGNLDTMNFKPDGEPNNMQLETVMLNLIHASVLKRATSKAYTG